MWRPRVRHGKARELSCEARAWPGIARNALLGAAAPLALRGHELAALPGRQQTRDCHQSKQLSSSGQLRAADQNVCAPGRTRTCNRPPALARSRHRSPRPGRRHPGGRPQRRSSRCADGSRRRWRARRPVRSARRSCVTEMASATGHGVDLARHIARRQLHGVVDREVHRHCRLHRAWRCAGDNDGEGTERLANQTGQCDTSADRCDPWPRAEPFLVNECRRTSSHRMNGTLGDQRRSPTAPVGCGLRRF
jgi:hypothetical protein